MPVSYIVQQVKSLKLQNRQLIYFSTSYYGMFVGTYSLLWDVCWYI